jgi:prepilin signal peptidase PulO-like enzyme (type II secretory pathway)
MMFSTFFLLSVLAIAAWNDWRTKTVPDRVSYSAIAIGLLLSLCHGGTLSPRDAFQSMLMLSGGMFWLAMLFESVTHREGLGFGDVKLAGVLGVFLGTQEGIRVIAYASWCALLVEGWQIVRKKKQTHGLRQMHIPFAPYLFFAALLRETLKKIIP